MTRFTSRAIVLLTLLGVLAPVAMAQRPQTREGFWLSFGLGGGSLGCEDCDDRESGGAGTLALGGKLSNTVLLGGSVSAWSKSEDGVTLTVGLVALEARFYPSSTGGFFLKAGAGLGTVDVEIGGASGNEDGKGILVGLGYDIRLGRMISLTPYAQWFGIDYNPGNANVSQLGIALTIH